MSPDEGNRANDGSYGAALAGPGGDGLCVGLVPEITDEDPQNGVFGVFRSGDPSWVGPRWSFDACDLDPARRDVLAQASLGQRVVYLGVAPTQAAAVELRAEDGRSYYVAPARDADTGVYAVALPDVGPLVAAAWLGADGRPIPPPELPRECTDPDYANQVQAWEEAGWNRFGNGRYVPGSGEPGSGEEVWGWVRLGGPSPTMETMRDAFDEDPNGNQRMPVYDRPGGTLIGYSYALLGVVDPALSNDPAFDASAAVTSIIGCDPNARDGVSPAEMQACQQQFREWAGVEAAGE